MLKLYKVVDSATGKRADVNDFEKKEEAKVVRNSLNRKHYGDDKFNARDFGTDTNFKKTKTWKKAPRFQVKRGSDHPKGESA